VNAKRPSGGLVAGARTATRVTVSTFGVMVGLAGIEHGIGEILQGNAAPEGVTIQSWPDAWVFDLLDSEPAMTVVPNFLATGVLAVLVSLVFLVWNAGFVHQKHGALVTILLSLVMLLLGTGFGPPILGVVLGAAATRIGAPLTRWRSQRLLAKLWPWTLVGGVTAFLMVLPGTVLLDYFFGVSEIWFAVPVLSFAILSAFGLLLLAIFAGFARDARCRAGLHKAPSTGG